MKKTISVALAFLMLFCCLSLTASAEDETPSAAPTGFNVTQALYVHAVTGSADGEALPMACSLLSAFHHTPLVGESIPPPDRFLER